MNLPNQLTGLRIVLTFFIMWCLFVSGLWAKVAALGLFVVAATTDWLDGFLARRSHRISPLGILLDPIADKILVIGLLLAFVQLRLVQAWMVLIIMLRELLITSVRLYAARRQIVIPAAQEGKHKTVSQMVTITLVLMLLVARETVHQDAIGAFAMWMGRVIAAAMWITVILTIISGASFFWRNRSLLDGTGR